jgi:hypothetical protein
MHDMDWPDYLRDQAAKYRQLAEQTLSSKTRCLSWRPCVKRLPMISRTISQAGRVDPFWGKLSTTVRRWVKLCNNAKAGPITTGLGCYDRHHQCAFSRSRGSRECAPDDRAPRDDSEGDGGYGGGALTSSGGNAVIVRRGLLAMTCKLILPIVPTCRIPSGLPNFHSSVLLPQRGTLRDRHERWERDAMDATHRSALFARTSDVFADGEVV